MPDSIPETHPLCNLFRSALDRAFTEFGELYSPGVSAHLRDDVLCDFVHVDRLYRLKNADGRRLEDLPKMLEVATRKEGPERRIEVDRYIGDFTLFMGGFFPGSIAKSRWFVPEPMVSRVGRILVQFERPLEYYAAEGRNAFERAAATATLFAPAERETYSLLAERFDAYVELLRRVKVLIEDDPDVQKVERAVD